jgi:hypothetical protein
VTKYPLLYRISFHESILEPSWKFVLMSYKISAP